MIHNRRQFALAWAACFGLLVWSRLLFQMDASVRLRRETYIPPPQVLPRMAFGYHEIISDSLWLRLIQDIEVCGKETISRDDFEKSLPGETDGKAEGGQREFEDDAVALRSDLLKSNESERVCMKGWAFRLLDAITELSPRFRIAYSLGATALSVLVNDHVGAKMIFDKGTERFPNDWPILYRAAYHYLYEIKDLPKAAQLLRRAGDQGAPDWVKSLAARLYTREGQAMIGLALLKDYHKTLKDDERRKAVEKRIARLEEIVQREISENKKRETR